MRARLRVITLSETFTVIARVYPEKTHTTAFVLNAEALLASLSPRNLASPTPPPSANPAGMRDFDTSVPTKTSL
jgi:hypothetical protein